MKNPKTVYTRKNLTKIQVEMLEMCHEMVIIARENLGEALGYRRPDDPYLYVETGACKPWRVATHKSLERLGLVTAEEVAHQVWHVRLTEEGAKVAKRIYVEKYGA